MTRPIYSAVVFITGCVLFCYSSSVDAATFYKCSSGYSFETNHNDSARCYKPATKQYKSPLKCADVRVPVANKSISHFLIKDYRDYADKCVGKFKAGSIVNENSVELTCPQNYKLEIRRGTDRCFKAVPAKAIAPSVRVN
ncbi:hypothetical protein [Paraglaciecola sp.]|uniref:hypothetical protein n=1 Tax=Paraglaciecola sp. TaxID=1920173 RepID=UPI003EF10ABF